MITYIYSLTDPNTFLVRYVGKSNKPKRRLCSHITRSKELKNHIGNWVRSLLNKGQKPILNILEKVDESVWQEAERKWIKYYRDLGNDLTNFTDGGDKGCPTYGRLGKKNSPEHIARTSAGRIGIKIKRSDEGNKKIADGVRRYYLNNKRKVFQYDKDGYFIKEWPSSIDAQISLNIFNVLSCAKGERNITGNSQWKFYRANKIPSYKNKKYYTRGVIQLTKDSFEISRFHSIIEASRKTGISGNNISNNLNNVSKSAGGYIWKYI